MKTAKAPSPQLLSALKKERVRKKIILDSIRNGGNVDDFEKHGIKIASPI